MNKTVFETSKEQIYNKLCLFSVKDIEEFKSKFGIKPKSFFIKDIVSKLKSEQIEEAFEFIDGINYSQNFEKRIGELVRMFGEKQSSDAYRLRLDFDFIIDGRIAEEYEDLPEKANCLVKYLQIESKDVRPWFHMVTAFTTHFPLMSNDKYGLSAINQSEWELVVKNIVTKYGYNTNDKNAIKELKRVNWINFIKENMFKIKLRQDSKWLKKKYSEYSLIEGTILDSFYSCFSTKNAEKLGMTFEELEDVILNSINKTEALFLKIIYPTLKAFRDSGYLGKQGYERYERWKRITEMVWHRVELFIKDLDIGKITQNDPQDILINNRLPNDPVPNVGYSLKKEGLKFEKRYPPKIGYPKGYDFRKFDIAAFDKAKKIELEKAKKLGHPRFEIVLNEEANECVALQLLGNFYFTRYIEKSKSDTWYKNDIIVPSYETIIIDHLDKDKTPYLLGDFNINMPVNFAPEFFIRVNINGEENIIEIRKKIDHIYDKRIQEKMCYDYSIGARLILDDIIDRYDLFWFEEALDVSQRSGQSFLLKTYRLYTTKDCIKSLEKYVNPISIRDRVIESLNR